MSQVAGQAAGQPLEGEVWYGPGSWKAEGGSMARENLIMRHCQEGEEGRLDGQAITWGIRTTSL